MGLLRHRLSVAEFRLRAVLLAFRALRCCRCTRSAFHFLLSLSRPAACNDRNRAIGDEFLLARLWHSVSRLAAAIFSLRAATQDRIYAQHRALDISLRHLHDMGARVSLVVRRCRRAESAASGRGPTRDSALAALWLRDRRGAPALRDAAGRRAAACPGLSGGSSGRGGRRESVRTAAHAH